MWWKRKASNDSGGPLRVYDNLPETVRPFRWPMFILLGMLPKERKEMLWEILWYDPMIWSYDMICLDMAWHDMRWFCITWYAVMTPIDAHKVYDSWPKEELLKNMYVTITSEGSWHLCHSWSAKTMCGKPHGSHVTTPLWSLLINYLTPDAVVDQFFTHVHHSAVSTTWASQHSAPSKWRTSTQWQQNRMGFGVADRKSVV